MKKKEFDLRKALMGHPLKTRDGHKALITGLTTKPEYPLIGVVVVVGDILQLTWNLDGEWSQFDGNSHYDLFLA